MKAKFALALGFLTGSIYMAACGGVPATLAEALGFALDVTYDNTASTLQAANVQDAIDENAANIQLLNGNTTAHALAGSTWTQETTVSTTSTTSTTAETTEDDDAAATSAAKGLTKDTAPITYTTTFNADGTFDTTDDTICPQSGTYTDLGAIIILNCTHEVAYIKIIQQETLRLILVGSHIFTLQQS